MATLRSHDTLAADPFTGIGHMLGHPFIQHAVAAGTAIALLCGLVGYFVVLRGQVFAGDALSHVAYTGALAALAAGLDLRLGLFGATIAVGFGLGLLGGRGIADDVVIGTTFAWVLGLGVFFLAYYTTHSATGNSTANVTVLFGSIFGISAHSAITAAEAAQVVGALLLLGLLAAPPAAAQRITANPWRAFGLSAVFAVASVWIGIALAYLQPRLPVSFTIIATAATIYLLATASTAIRRRKHRDLGPTRPTAGAEPQLVR